jgi:hypothetical protein
VFSTAHNVFAAGLHAFIIIPTRAAQLIVHLPLLTQVAGDDTTVIEAVLACDTERTQLLKEEQTLLKQLNKEAPDQTHAATANGHSATANGTAATPNGSSATAAESGATAADARDSNGAGGGDAVVDGKAAVGKAADAAESKAAAQLAQVQSMNYVSRCVQLCDQASSSSLLLLPVEKWQVASASCCLAVQGAPEVSMES